MKVELPCRVGAKIWEVSDNYPYLIRQNVVKGFKVTGKMKVLPLIAYDIPLEIGVNGFLSREEAERRVRELKKGVK